MQKVLPLVLYVNHAQKPILSIFHLNTIGVVISQHMSYKLVSIAICGLRLEGLPVITLHRLNLHVIMHYLKTVSS